MRVSVNEKSPHYNQATRFVRVYLDGNELNNVQEFDTVLGYVWKYYDDLKEDIYGNYLIEQVRGKITLKLGSRAQIVGGVLTLD